MVSQISEYSMVDIGPQITEPYMYDRKDGHLVNNNKIHINHFV